MNLVTVVILLNYLPTVAALHTHKMVIHEQYNIRQTPGVPRVDLKGVDCKTACQPME